MGSNNYYDVTEWNVGNPYKDIGEVINSIIADIKSRHCTNRKYIYEIGKFDEYLNYLSKCIEENK